jgi:PAS domain S-box-containing protein
MTETKGVNNLANGRVEEGQRPSSVGLTGAWGITVAFTVLLGILGLHFWTTEQATKASTWVAHTYQVKGNLQKVLSVLQDAETGQRGYLLTGNESYLEPFTLANGRIDDIVADLRILTQDNVRRQELIGRIEPLITEKLDELKETISLRRAKKIDVAIAIVRSDRGKLIMDRIRGIIAEMESEEATLLAARQRDLEQKTTLSTASEGIGIVFLIGIAVVVFFRINNALTAHRRAEETLRESDVALQNAHDVLEARVEERTREISQVNREFKREIVEREQAQDFFKALLHAAPDPVITVDRDGKIVVTNRQLERVFGYSSEELIGQSVEILLPEHLRDSHVHHRNDYFGDAKIRPMGAVLDLSARCKNGRKVAVEVSLSPLQTTKDTFAIAVIRDITGRKQSEELLKYLNTRLITAQEEERSRIARELHDDFSQSMALVAVDLERLHDAPPDAQEHLVDDLASLLRRTKEVSSGLHRLSHQLHPSILDLLGLVAATRSFCKEISDQNGIDIEFVNHGGLHFLPGDVALCAYRVVQEALRNAIKHSGAQNARVEITKTAGELKMQISDSGTGFDPEIARTHSGLGLFSMRERLRQVNGTISFMRNEPTGARIDVRIPIQDSSQP